MPKFAAHITKLFKEYDFQERFYRAAKHGFKAVEFMWPYEYKKENLAKIIKDTGLKVALFNTTAGDISRGQWGHAGLPGYEKEFKDEIAESLEYAHVQVAVAPSRHEPDEGEINYDYIFKLLDNVGYKGYVGLEYNPRGKTVDGLGFLKKYM